MLYSATARIRQVGAVEEVGMNSPAMAARSCGGRLLGLELSGGGEHEGGKQSSAGGVVGADGCTSVVIGGAEMRHRRQEVAGQNSVKSP
jgi:hypothetical protein